MTMSSNPREKVSRVLRRMPRHSFRTIPQRLDTSASTAGARQFPFFHHARSSRHGDIHGAPVVRRAPKDADAARTGQFPELLQRTGKNESGKRALVALLPHESPGRRDKNSERSFPNQHEEITISERDRTPDRSPSCSGAATPLSEGRGCARQRAAGHSTPENQTVW